MNYYRQNYGKISRGNLYDELSQKVRDQEIDVLEWLKEAVANVKEPNYPLPSPEAASPGGTEAEKVTVVEISR